MHFLIIFCQGMTSQKELIHHVPTLNGDTALDLTLLSNQDHHQQIVMSPWPFQQNEVTLVYEGQLLRHIFSSEIAMREALIGDYIVTLTTTLRPD